MNCTQTEPNALSHHHILTLGIVRGTWHLNFTSASGSVLCCVLLQRAVWRCRVRTSTSAPWHLARCLASWLFCTTASGRPPSRVSVAWVTVTISVVQLYVVCGVQQWRTQEFCSGGVQQIQLRTEDRENRDLGGGSPLVRGSGGSCNLVQEISFHIVKFS